MLGVFSSLDSFVYLTKHVYEPLVAISKEAAGILEYKLLPFINMKLNLKIESIYNTSTLSNGS